MMTVPFRKLLDSGVRGFGLLSITISKSAAYEPQLLERSPALREPEAGEGSGKRHLIACLAADFVNITSTPCRGFWSSWL